MSPAAQVCVRELLAAVHCKRRLCTALLCLVAFAATAERAGAQTAVSWTSTSSGLWSTGTNWSTGGPPANSLTTNYALFNNAAGVTVTVDTSQDVAGIQFDANAGSYTVSRIGGGKDLTLGSYGVRNYSSNNQTITGSDLRLTLGAASTFLNDGTGHLTISTAGGSISTSSSNTLTLRGTGAGTITSAIGGSGSLTKLDSGTWTMSSTSTNYTGATIIGSAGGASGGTLVMGNSNVLGSGAFVIYAGTLDTGSGSFSDTGKPLTLGGGASGTTASITGNGTINLGGNVTYDATNNPSGALISANLNQNGNDRTFSVGDSTAASADLTVSGVIAGTKQLIKAGAGTLVLSGDNTYSDGTIINIGTVAVYTLANGGVASGIGMSSNGAAELDLQGGTLKYLGAGSSTDRLFSLGTTGGTLDASGTGAVVFSNTGAIRNDGGSSTRVLTLMGTSTADNTLNPILTSTSHLTKAGTSTWIIGTGNNSYTGVTTLAGGILSVGTLANGGANSSIGAATNAASNLVFTGGTLKYTGGSVSTDRLFTVGAGGGAIDASGTGAVTFGNSGSLAATGTGARTLTLSGTNVGSNTLASALTDSSATDRTALAKSGTGTWTLTGNNTHTGGTTLNSGKLNLNSATALGGSAGVFTINGGTFDNTTAGALVLSGNNVQNWNGDFVFAGTQNLNLGTGAVTLNATPTVTVSAGTLTVGGAISGSDRGLTKIGPGTLALTGTNSSYTGATTINAGTLSVAALANGGSNSSIGAASAGASNLVLNGGTLQYTGNGNSSDRLFSVGTSGGTLEAAGSGSLAFSNSGSMGFNGQSGARTLTLTGSSNGSIAAALADNGGATAMTKTGTGTWTLNGTASNTYTGTTTVNAGTLALEKSGGAIAISGDITIGDGSGVDTVRLDANNQLASRSVITFTAGGTPTLNLNGYSQTLDSLASSNTAAQLQLGSPAGSSALTVGDGSITTFAGVISGGSGAGFVKTGSGSLTLSGTNTYTGTTTVSQGTLNASGASSLGAATGAVNVTPGGSLWLSAGTTITKSATLSLNGSGASSTVGALHAGGGATSTSKWSGNIALTGNSTASAVANLLIIGDGALFTNTLTLDANTLRLEASSAPVVTPTYEPLPAYALDATNILVNSKITGAGGVTKTGVGTVTIFAGAAGGNTFTGDTIVAGGRLILDGVNNTPAINSANVYVGNAVAPGAADSVILQVGQLANGTGPQNVIGTWNAGTNASTTNVTIYSDGVFKMNNAAIGLGTLTLQGGHVDAGNVATSPVLTLSGGLTTAGSSQTARFNNGKLAMSANNFAFNVASGTTASGIDLQVDSIVQDGAGYSGGSSGTSLMKLGAGKMVLSNANTYTGMTSIGAGVLNIQNASALGQAGAFNGDAANGTVVQSGGQLQLQGGITVGALESLTLNGGGIGNDGALRNFSGNNSYNGFVYLGSDSRINADSGTLTIANTNGAASTIINGTAAGRNLTFGGAGNTVVGSGIGASVGEVAKDGAGTLTLAGSNSYSGGTSITAGAVKVTHSDALSGTGAVVGNGAALQFAQDGNGNNIAIGPVGATINGTGPNGGGAIQNLTGNNSYAGAVTLGSSALIAANSGTSLNLSGGIGTSAHGLVVGTAANNGDITIAGNVSGGGSLTKAGTGTLTFSGANTVFGAVTMNSGTLAFSGTDVTAGAVHLNGGSIAVGMGTTATTGAVDAISSTTFTIASGGSVVANYVSGTTTFSGALGGEGEFQKDGAGTLVFNNTFSAPDLTLTLNGGTLSLVGGQFTFGTIHITGNTILDFNNSAGTFLSSANLIIDSGVSVTVNNWTSIANNAAMSSVWYATSTINGGTLGGDHQLGGTPLSQITFTSYIGAGKVATWVSGTSYGWFDHEIRPTPEPATYGLILVAGCSAFFGFRRFRRMKR